MNRPPKWWMWFWPTNPYGIPRFIPIYTKWATKRWHTQMWNTWYEGFNRGMRR